jgi:hypothetical protein
MRAVGGRGDQEGDNQMASSVRSVGSVCALEMQNCGVVSKSLPISLPRERHKP